MSISKSLSILKRFQVGRKGGVEVAVFWIDLDDFWSRAFLEHPWFRHGKSALEGVPVSYVLRGEAEIPEIGGNCLIQSPRLGLLLPQLRGEPPHLLLEWLAIVFLRLSADVASRVRWD
jgi:hypothetical protein